MEERRFGGWLRRENEEILARTRSCCGWPSSLHCSQCAMCTVHYTQRGSTYVIMTISNI